MKILVWGTYRKNYARNQLIFDGLKKNGVTVLECHHTLWKGEQDRLNLARGGWISPVFWFRAMKVYILLVLDFFKIKDFDILYVAYPGHFDVYIAKILASIKKRPLVWDVLNSLYLIMLDRKIQKNLLQKLTISMIYQIEKLACWLPSMLFLDNEKFVEWFCDLYKLRRSKFRTIPIGADGRYFYPKQGNKADKDKKVVIYYGTYIPNHGIPVILMAAKELLGYPGITFLMVGDGPGKEEAECFAKEKKLINMSFLNWLSHEELSDQIADSHIVLGAFGITKQLSLTNNNKIYEGFAMKKAVISSFSNAMYAEIRDGINIKLCKGGDPIALAESILYLVENPEIREKISEAGYETYLDKFENRRIGEVAMNHLQSLL